MVENKKTPIIIDNVEYFFEDMNQDQKIMVNHIADLDKKLISSKFNLDQLNVGKDAFINMLKTSLTNTIKGETNDNI